VSPCLITGCACRGAAVPEGLEVERLFLSDRVPIVLTQSKAVAQQSLLLLLLLAFIAAGLASSQRA
jgi:hypothetical protein